MDSALSPPSTRHRQLTNNGVDLVAQAVHLLKAIEKCPPETLTSSFESIKQLSASTRRLSRNMRRKEVARNNRSAETTRANSQEAHNQPNFRESDARQLLNIRTLLSAAIALIPDIKQAVYQFQWPEEACSVDTLRTMHIQNILTLQEKRTRIGPRAPERILVLCACRSLARDYYDFEIRRGWEPKQDQIVDRILCGQDPAVQSISKHFQEFLAAQNYPMPVDETKLDAALRFGTKLGVVHAIGKEAGIGCLCLVLGFEFVKFTRVTFAPLRHLRAVLQDADARKTLQSFAASMNKCWSICHEDYHLRFTSIARKCGAIQNKTGDHTTGNVATPDSLQASYGDTTNPGSTELDVSTAQGLQAAQLDVSTTRGLQAAQLDGFHPTDMTMWDMGFSPTGQTSNWASSVASPGWLEEYLNSGVPGPDAGLSSDCGWASVTTVSMESGPLDLAPSV